jgi:formylglycine-generating enzyme required for sulfatase activity
VKWTLLFLILSLTIFGEDSLSTKSSSWLALEKETETVFPTLELLFEALPLFDREKQTHAAPLLIALFKEEKKPEVGKQILITLEKMGKESTVSILPELVELAESNKSLRIEIGGTLLKISSAGENEVKRLEPWLSHSDPEIRSLALVALKESGAKASSVSRVLTKRFIDVSETKANRISAGEILSGMGPVFWKKLSITERANLLVRLKKDLKDPGKTFTSIALKVGGSLGKNAESLIPMLVEMAKESEEATAALALINPSHKSSIKEFKRILEKDPSLLNRLHALKGLHEAIQKSPKLERELASFIGGSVKDKLLVEENKRLEKLLGITKKYFNFIKIKFPKEGRRIELGDSSQRNNKPREVFFTKDFEIQTTEVTQGLWEEVEGNNPSFFHGDPGLPVENLTWYQAQDFIMKLNQMDGKYEYRLPFEVEWEYAARGGVSGPDFFRMGLENASEYAWTDSSTEHTNPVAQKKPNELGLYDIFGNTWEWVQDEYVDDVTGYLEQVVVTHPGFGHVIRGGSWYNDFTRANPVTRFSVSPTGHHSNLGFRLVRNKK